MEVFSCIVSKACELGELKDLRAFDGGPAISHLLYADDALILGEWSRGNIENTARLLRVFYICSGLKIKLKKSSLFGIGDVGEEVAIMARTLGCRVGEFPFDYLGIKVGAKTNKSCHWDSVIDTIKRRLASWKANSLSMGGRLTLIKSVLASLPVYYLSLYKAPNKATDQMEKLMRNFLWAGSSEDKKLSWVAWDTVTKSKENGGLGVSRLKDVNFAILAKWAWRFQIQKDSVWRKVVEMVHGGRGRWDFLPLNCRFNGCWNSIVKVLARRSFKGKSFNSFIRAKIGKKTDGLDFIAWSVIKVARLRKGFRYGMVIRD
ncbi:putative RNA-directed DNA polymerase [Helianthus annuus]|nr:putative RNA-directed DNA polymerase [Helianthus annuus]